MYTCDNCGRKFKESRHLDQHHRRKTPCDKQFKCEKCNTFFPKKSLLARHENRKTPCAPEEIPIIYDDNPENRCQYCNKTYATKSNLTRHLKTCDKEVNLAVIMDMMIKHEGTMQQAIKIFNQQKPGSVTNNITNNNLYLNNTLCHFGEEDYTLLDQKKIQRLLLDEPQKFVPGLIRELHLNPSLPQYHNVYYDSKREQGMVFTRVMINGIMVSTWQKKEISSISKDLVAKAKRYPTCMPLAQGIKPNSIEEQRYCRGLQIVTREYEHTEQDLINNREMLTSITKNPGFFKMIEETTHISGSLPLIHLN